MKFIIGVIIGTLLADSIKKLAVKAWEWFKDLDFWNKLAGN